MSEDLREDIKALIANLIGKQDNSEKINFLTAESVKILHNSPVNYIDRNEVKENIFGFIDKFKVYGFPKKANHLKTLLDKYFESGYIIFEETVKWNILYFLCKLSYKPTSGRDEIKVLSPEDSYIEQFDWPSYLLEGLPHYRRPTSDDDLSFSSDDEPEEEDEYPSLNELTLIPSKSQVKQSSPCSSSQPTTIQLTFSNLKECLIASSDARKKKMKSMGKRLPHLKILSEHKLVRIILWILNKPKNSFIFYKRGDIYVPMRDISLSSLTPKDMSGCLREIGIYLPAILGIDNFVEEIRKTGVFSNELPSTYIAYASALADLMVRFRDLLMELESLSSRQESSVLVTGVKKATMSWLKQIDIVFQIHKKATFENWKLQENWVCSIRLLGVLCDALKYCDASNRQIIFILFIKSLKPYLDILGKWSVFNHPFDPKNEFILARPSRGFQDGNVIVRDHQAYLKVINVTETIFFDIFVYCSLLVCSSVEFLIILNREADLLKYKTDKVLIYDEFVSSVCTDLKIGPNNELPNPLQSSLVSFRGPDYLKPFMQCRRPPETTAKNTNSCTNISNNVQYSMKIITNNDYVEKSFSPFLTHKTIPSKNNPFECLEKFKIQNLPNEKTLAQKFIKNVTKCMQPPGFAKEILLNDLNLIDHLVVLRKIYIYMFHESLSMNTLSKDLFKQVLDKTFKAGPWIEKLKESLRGEIPNFLNNFTFVSTPYSVAHYLSNSFNPIPYLNNIYSIRINYQAPPPLNLIITESCIEKYNELWHFYLKLDFAKYCLTFFFKDVNYKHFQKEVNELCLLRHSMWTFFVTIHSYCMSASYQRMDTDIKNICSMSSHSRVISAGHERILDKWRSHCFLLGSPEINLLVNKFLDLCIELRLLWNIHTQGLTNRTAISNVKERYTLVVEQLSDGLTLRHGYYCE